jgi:hypothetical protein
VHPEGCEELASQGRVSRAPGVSLLCVASLSPPVIATELIRTSHPILEGLFNEHISALATLAMPVSYSAE